MMIAEERASAPSVIEIGSPRANNSATVKSRRKNEGPKSPRATEVR